MTSTPARLGTRKHKCFVACAPGLERTLAIELKRTCSVNSRLRRSGVDCALTLEQIYRFCLWSRIANRVLYPLNSFQIDNEKSYYNALKKIDWADHVSVSGTVAVDFFCASSCITHSRYGAQLTKDAVVDWFRERTGDRPGVDRDTPDIRINVYLFRDRARVSLDMSGHSLHRRNYRLDGSSAPLKENLAAAIVQSSQWRPATEPLHDPMCGSGTLLIEAAMIAGNIAPGIQRDYYGFKGWCRHDDGLWQSLLEEANVAKTLDNIPEISGADIDPAAIESAKANIHKAGLSDHIAVQVQDFFQGDDRLAGASGLVIINPPYGERLEEKTQLGRIYGQLGRALKQKAPGWRLSLFTGAPDLYHRIGFDRDVVLECANGGIDSKLFLSKIPRNSNRQQEVAAPVRSVDEVLAGGKSAPGIDQFADRLRKNIKQIKGWAKSSGATNYRVYDADLPDYAFALDVYHDVAPQSGPYLCMQEYKAPSHIDEDLAELRLASAARVVQQQLACEESNLSIKRRDRQRGMSQYSRLSQSEVFHPVSEGNCRLLINIHDYLDCGLFLDHRKVRQWIGGNSKGKRFLNLYCYTAAATAHAAVGGAIESVSVDLSQKYLAWAKKNFLLNQCENNSHRLERADCSEWIDVYIAGQGQAFDLIFFDPPTFSNSTSTDRDWDVQRDHESMIDRCMSILSRDGTLIFSNNFRRFKLSEQIAGKYNVQNKTRWSLQRDFSRSTRIHQCWFIRH